MKYNRMQIQITGGFPLRPHTEQAAAGESSLGRNALFRGNEDAPFTHTLALLSSLPHRTAPPALHARIHSLLHTKRSTAR